VKIRPGALHLRIVLRGKMGLRGWPKWRRVAVRESYSFSGPTALDTPTRASTALTFELLWKCSKRVQRHFSDASVGIFCGGGLPTIVPVFEDGLAGKSKRSKEPLTIRLEPNPGHSRERRCGKRVHGLWSDFAAETDSRRRKMRERSSRQRTRT